jgi:hypothetical protein
MVRRRVLLLSASTQKPDCFHFTISQKKVTKRDFSLRANDGGPTATRLTHGGTAAAPVSTLAAAPEHKFEGRPRKISEIYFSVRDFL